MNTTFGNDAAGYHRGVFGTTFSRGWAARHLTDDAWLRALIRTETALIAAWEQAGVITADQANAIRRAWDSTPVDLAAIGSAASAGGNPVIPLVELLRAAVPDELRPLVHLGTTSQDIMDTAQMLLMRQALDVILIDLHMAADVCATLASGHARTPMPGRTLMQDALPISFGYKAAGWMSGLDGAESRVAAVSAGLPVQFGGPVGTFSDNGGNGPAVRQLLAAELGLVDPPIAWHTLRLPIADLAGALGTAAGIAGKVSLDIVLLAQSGIAELAEGAPGRGGSSSMTHKHNPIAAISSRACALRVPGLVATLFATMAQEHERAAGAWHAEWETLTDLTRLTGSAVAWLVDSLQHLTVNATQMTQAAAHLCGSKLVEQAAVLTEEVLQQRLRGREQP